MTKVGGRGILPGFGGEKGFINCDMTISNAFV